MNSPTADRDAVSTPAPHTRQKNPIVATLLNLCPGLGLAYLGRWGFAITNVLIAVAVFAGCYLLDDPTISEHIHWVWMVLLVGSAAAAHGLAKSQP